MTEQSQKWAGEFGDSYTDRNPKNIKELNQLYIREFGLKRTDLNEKFLNELPKTSKILEVGCNIGAQLDGLNKQGFTNLFAIEISPYATKQAKKLLLNTNIITASALDIPFKDNYFDIVFTAGVLIHIHPNDIPKVIDEIYRTSKKYLWCFEYFSENCEEIEYQGNKNLLWKNDFMKIFLERHPDLKVVKEKKINYLDNDNLDHMFLLEKTNNLDN